MKRIFAAIFAFVASAQLSLACTTIIVGKKATVDGSILVARNDDGPGITAVNFLYHPPRRDGYTLRSVMKNKFSYEMPSHLMGYTGSPRGSGSAYDESGFNDAGVGVSATETIVSNARTLSVDPYVKETGIVEEVIPTIILSQAKSAREGVELLGALVESHGSAEGFGVAFVDSNEAWYLENAGGHQWLAMKIPDDSYFVSANQSRLGEFDPDDHNILSSPNLVGFAQTHGLYDRGTDGPFSFRRAFGRDNEIDVRYNYPRVAQLQKWFTANAADQSVTANGFPTFRRPDHPVAVTDVQRALQDYFAGTPSDPYTSGNPAATARPISVYRTYQSHVLQTRKGLPEGIANVEYLDLGMTALGIYLPFYQGAAIPESYRGVTGDSDDSSAFWQFRKVQLLAMQDFPHLAPIVRSRYDALALAIADKQLQFEKDYARVAKTDRVEADRMRDRFTRGNVDAALAVSRELVNTLVTQLSLRTNQLYRFPGS
ncbi:C69 family dipeptidase [Paraburkholderia dipogonis]|uniref:Dipeptidase n=2 Tax=Paraburkholderia dipogonis TaxID=1211383 RepID=A0A4Y8NBQ3_9BURK|nr:C69 family dipeptidase [Paraburkholderia dipogonis]